MKLKSIVAGVALLSSGAASAGVTGNVGAFSEYMFRGVEQTGGAAVQGGVDYAGPFGLYAGTWVSNTSFAGVSPGVGTVSYETDLYGGWTQKWDFIGVDLGLYYYYYRDDVAFNTIEAYAALLLGAGKVKLYYTPAYFGVVDAAGDDEEGFYLTADYPIPLNKDGSLTLAPQVGVTFGDGPEAFFGADPVTSLPDGEYVDYSLTLGKTLDSGFAFSLAIIGTTLDTTAYPDDKEKIVIGLKKTFDL